MAGCGVGSPVLCSLKCCRTVQYMRRKWPQGGISKRLRAKADRGYHWQGARISPEDGGGREGQVGWRRMPPVCVGSGLQLKTWVSAVAAVLCFAAEKRLCAASKRANQRRPARRVRRTSSSHQSSLKPKARDLFSLSWPQYHNGKALGPSPFLEEMPTLAPLVAAAMHSEAGPPEPEPETADEDAADDDSAGDD